MGILLDTHFVLWYAKGDSRMPTEVRQVVEDLSTAVFTSEVSVLEIAIKHAKNPKVMPYSGEDFVKICKEARFDLRPLTLDAILAYEHLAFDKVGDLHKDPFDRLLICQAKTEGLTLATPDRILALYDESAVKVYV